jgi:hypothetical protein
MFLGLTVIQCTCGVGAKRESDHRIPKARKTQREGMYVTQGMGIRHVASMALTYTYPCNANSNSSSGLVWLRALLGFPRCAAIKSWVWVAACLCLCLLPASKARREESWVWP